MQWDDAEDDVPPIDNPMAERLISLVLLLESSSRGFTRQEIVRRVRGYSADDVAAARMFERDKRELLSVGIVIDSYQSDPLDPASFRYRVFPDQAQLPPVEFTADERKVLQAALNAWRQTPHDTAAKQARYKLEALGLQFNDATPIVELQSAIDLEPVMDALAHRRAIRFEYRKRGAGQTEVRRVQTWGIALRDGKQFLYGFDLDRADQRIFNLARVTSKIAAFGEDSSYEIPTQVDVEAMLRPEYDPAAGVRVKLRVAAGQGAYWRRFAAAPAAADRSASELEIELSAPFTMIPRLAGDAPGVVVLEPAEIRQRVAQLVRGANGAV